MSFCVVFFFFFKQKTAYEMRISDWSSDVCSSDLPGCPVTLAGRTGRPYLAPASGGARRRASHRAGLAQLVEHLICNQGVAGSNPAAGTTLPQVQEPPPQAPPRPRRKEDIAAGRQPVIASIPAVSPDLAQAFAEGTTVQLRRLLPYSRRAPPLPPAALCGAPPAPPLPRSE